MGTPINPSDSEGQLPEQADSPAGVSIHEMGVDDLAQLYRQVLSRVTPHLKYLPYDRLGTAVPLGTIEYGSSGRTHQMLSGDPWGTMICDQTASDVTCSTRIVAGLAHWSDDNLNPEGREIGHTHCVVLSRSGDIIVLDAEYEEEIVVRSPRISERWVKKLTARKISVDELASLLASTDPYLTELPLICLREAFRAWNEQRRKRLESGEKVQGYIEQLCQEVGVTGWWNSATSE